MFHPKVITNLIENHLSFTLDFATYIHQRGFGPVFVLQFICQENQIKIPGKLE